MKIAVIDTETTDLSPHIGHIVEVAMVTVDTETAEIKRIYNMLVHPNLDKDAIERSWIVRNGHIDIDLILKARVPHLVAHGLRHHLGDLPWTSYNNDFDKGFLCQKPWNLPEPSLPCIMKQATWACKIPSLHDYDPMDEDAQIYKWPKLVQAHHILVEKPELPFAEPHRAMGDAWMAAEVLIELIKNGYYEIA